MAEPAELLLVTEESFDREVLKSSVPVVVDFYADWCGPCRVAEPILRQISGTLAGKVKFTKVNVDESDAISRSFGIHSIPTYVFVAGGQEKGRQIGAIDATEFRSILKRHFAFA
jgi:thioredoxin 1